MNADLHAADARWEVRRAAERWRRAGAIDEPTLAAIRERFPDDRRRSRAAFRVLFFVLTLLAGQGTWGFVYMFVGLAGDAGALGHAVLLTLLAAGCGLAAAAAIERLRLRGFGVEEALVYLASGFEVAAFVIAADGLGLSPRAIAFATGIDVAAVATFVALRWGIFGSGAFAVGGLLLALAALPHPRALWLVGAALITVGAARIARAAGAAVAHRRRADEAFVVATVALYFAAHASQAADVAFATMAGESPPERHQALVALAWAAMVALPASCLLAGWRRRERLVLGLGLVFALATATTAVDALDWGPPWAVFLGAGTLLGALVLALRAALARRRGRTLGGWTDAALYAAAGEGTWLELAASLAVFAPAPGPPRRDEEVATFQGEGGEFGGGGASSKF